MFNFNSCFYLIPQTVPAEQAYSIKPELKNGSWFCEHNHVMKELIQLVIGTKFTHSSQCK